MMTGVNMVHVPYRSVAAAMADMLSGQVQVTFGTTASTIEYIRAGALRARMSGICNPVYVLDLPQGGGKVPLGPCYVEGRDGETWRIRGQDGEERAYREVVEE